jgi:hypothetical protein
MVWPFPTKDVSAQLCSERYGRTRSCLADWRAAEQSLAGMILAVNILVMLWQGLVVYRFRPDVNWLKSWVDGRRAEQRGQRRAIEDAVSYMDEPTDGQREDADGRSDGRVNQDEESRGEGYVVQPSRLR